MFCVGFVDVLCVYVVFCVVLVFCVRFVFLLCFVCVFWVISVGVLFFWWLFKGCKRKGHPAGSSWCLPNSG